MALTDVKCRSAKAGPARLKLSDGGGLQLWVQTNGARLWQLAYRFRATLIGITLPDHHDTFCIKASGVAHAIEFRHGAAAAE